MTKKNYRVSVKKGKVFSHDIACLNCDSFCHNKGTESGYCYENDETVSLRCKCSQFFWKEKL